MRKFAICFNGSDSRKLAKRSSKMHNGGIVRCPLSGTICFIKNIKTEGKVIKKSPVELLTYYCNSLPMLIMGDFSNTDLH